VQRSRLKAAAIAVISVLAQPGAMVHAQTSTTQQTPMSSVLADIKSATIRTIGAQTEAVEVTARGTILTVLRVNSNMNESTHAGRDNEANVIASIVSKAISDNPEFKKLTTIRVQYVTRTAKGAVGKIFDTVDFHKDPKGLFNFHQT
jgi:hypothetical protein